MVSAASSSVLLKRNAPLGALPTAVYSFTIYACLIFYLRLIKSRVKNQDRWA